MGGINHGINHGSYGGLLYCFNHKKNMLDFPTRLIPGGSLSYLWTAQFEAAWITMSGFMPVISLFRISGTQDPYFVSRRKETAHISHRIHFAAIYGNIYHQYTPVMLALIYHTYQHHGSVMGFWLDGFMKFWGRRCDVVLLRHSHKKWWN